MDLPPVTRTDRLIAWHGRGVTLADFREIIAYVNACTGQEHGDIPAGTAIIHDTRLLDDLLASLDAQIPWFTESEEYDLQVIPAPSRDGPEPPPKPEQPSNVSELQWQMLLQIPNALRDHPRSFPDATELPVEVIQRYHNEVAEYLRQKAAWKPPPPTAAETAAAEQRLREIASLKARYGTKKRIVARVRKELASPPARDAVKVLQLPWELLPGGHSDFETIRSRAAAWQKSQPGRVYEDQRLAFLFGRHPVEVWVGSDAFDGYFAFVFGGWRKVVFECPWKGNALYVVDGDWKSLSQLSKKDLLANHSHRVEKFIHDEAGEWKTNLLRTLTRPAKPLNPSPTDS